MTTINNYNFGYLGHDNLINNFNLSLLPGQKYVLLGYNGVGKSSVLRALWEAAFDGDKRVTLPVARAYLGQDIDSSLSLNPQNILECFYELQYAMEVGNSGKTVRDLAFDTNVMDWFTQAVTLLPNNYKQKLNLNLFDLRLSPLSLATRYSYLSPGTKKKIMLSVLFATQPELIIIDELTNHLDKEVIEILSGWVKTSSSSMLLVDHSEAFLNRLGKVNYLFLPNNKDRQVLNFPDCTFLEVMTRLDELRERQAAEQEIVLRRKKQLENNLKLQQYRAQTFGVNIGAAGQAIKKKIEREVNQNSILSEADLRKEVKFQAMDNRARVKKNLLLRMDNLSYLIGSDRVQSLLEQKIYHGERVRITGPNGRGKSTLISLLRAASEGKLAQHPQYLQGNIELGDSLAPQDIFTLEQITDYGHSIPIDNFLRQHTKMQAYEIPGFLRGLELGKFELDSDLSHLSIGEFIRLQLGILSKNLHSTRLLILDEPGNFLDIFTQKALINLLKNYHGTLLLITHDDLLAEKLGYDRQIELV